jgi:hypothetical protein
MESDRLKNMKKQRFDKIKVLSKIGRKIKCNYE